MNLMSLNRWKASTIHLACSALIATTIIVLMLALWYPGAYFTAMGGQMLVLIVVGVDVVLGPLITLIIFDTRKKSLKFDLGVIVAVQVAALVYGCYVMFEARPVYNVFVVDRLKELIKYHGYQVPPAELEAVLLTDDRIADAAVIGVQADGSKVPKAFVVPMPGVELTAEDVMDYVAERVAPYKKVRQVEFIDAVPKAASGKILRRELRAREATRE